MSDSNTMDAFASADEFYHDGSLDELEDLVSGLSG
jgi:hypothetical protein